MASRAFRLGVLVPSSNTALEPLTTAMINSITDHDLHITVHYSRFRVTQVSLDKSSSAQFDLPTILDAAGLLVDAHVDVIGWSGTSAGWLGFDTDRDLCEAIQTKFHIPATTSTLALLELLRKSNASELGLVTPYLKDMNEAIMANFTAAGFTIEPHKERHLGISQNDDIAKITDAVLEGLVQDVANTHVPVITTYCTNLRAAHKAAGWEQLYDTMFLDSVSTVVWGMLKQIGVKPNVIKGWGKMFEIE